MGKLCNGCKTSLPEQGNVGSLNLSEQNHGRGEAGTGTRGGGLNKTLKLLLIISVFLVPCWSVEYLSFVLIFIFLSQVALRSL